MTKWLRLALIFLAIALPVLWVVSTVYSYGTLMDSRRLMSESNNGNTTRPMEKMHVRMIVNTVTGLFHNLAISGLSLFAAHQLSVYGKSKEAKDG